MENNDEVICSNCKKPIIIIGDIDQLDSHSWICQECTKSEQPPDKRGQSAFEKDPKTSIAITTDSPAGSLIVIECNVPNCSFVGNNDEFLIHLMRKHEADLLDIFDHSCKPDSQKELNISSRTKDLITTRINLAGREAKLGATGKFYCQAKLNGPCFAESAECCGGYCGPTYGCNCRACQVLDIEARGLSRGYWVNPFGATCIMEANNKIYCGRPMSVRIKKTHCGTTPESQCYSCRALEFQLGDRYADINQP